MSFVYHKPKTVGEALALVALKPGVYPILAGGTDIVAQWRAGTIKPEGLIDISALGELAEIKATKAHIEIGALATYADIAANADVRERLPALADVCASVGGAQIQNMGTIGGNVMNASPAADMPPVLVALEADFIAKDLKGDSAIGSDDFFVGYKRTALEPGKLLAAIRIPLPGDDELTRFYRIGARRAQAIAKVSMCLRARIAHGGIEWIRIALGSVAPTVVRAPGTEALLSGKAINTGLIDKARRSLADEMSPIDDVRSTADYRKYAAVGMLMKFLREATALSPKS